MSDRIRVAFQGELGAYSEEAAYRYFGAGVEPVPCREFHDVAAALEEGRVDRGLLPVENTLAGSVRPTYQLLTSGRLAVIGEVIIPIHHCVLAQPGVELGDLTRVYSHPVALAQCTTFLRSHPALDAIAVYDTAGAAKRIAGGSERAAGALAGRRAAERYGLRVLVPDVEDRSDNQTRFLLVRRATEQESPPADASGEPGKSLLLARVPNRAGGLLRLLQPFAEAGLNLAKLETHPDMEPWTSLFFLEVEAPADHPAMAGAIRAARSVSLELRLLGSYRRWPVPEGR